jgi:ketosteroid isomerase-like protein
MLTRIIFSAVLIASAVVPCVAQDSSKEINEHVWNVFIKSFSEHDANTFLSVHSKDVIRAVRDQKMLLDWAQYLKQQLAGDKFEIDNGIKRTIELRFSERISSSTQAVDVGIYKTTVTQKDGGSDSFYGRFHVVLRKESGVWKILVDTDSTEGNTIDENVFLEAKPL